MKHLKDEPLEPPPIPVPAAPSAATAPSAAAGLAAAAALYSAVAQANAAAAAAAAAAGIPSSKKDDETEEDGEVCVLYNSIPYNAMPVVFFFAQSSSVSGVPWQCPWPALMFWHTMLYRARGRRMTGERGPRRQRATRPRMKPLHREQETQPSSNG